MILAAGMLLAVTLPTRAQGYGFYIGDKYVQLNEGDKVTFSENAEQTAAQGEEGSFVTDIKVETSDGQVTVYQASQIVFQGDIEQYFHAMQAWLVEVNDYYDQHWAWGYGSIMHMRDVMTADMARPQSGYNWYSSLAQNQAMGKQYYLTNYIYSYYQTGVNAANSLIAALKVATTLTAEQQFYLSMAYAFRALNYLEMAQMYEYLPTEGTPSHEFGGFDVTGLTVPIVREDTDLKEALPRATREEMVEFIQNDLAQAESHIADQRRASKMAPNLFCVYGLYARLYMWIGDYEKAALYAGKVVEQSGLEPLLGQDLINPTKAFNDMSAGSWMWGIAPTKYDRTVVSALLNWGGWMCNECTYGYASIVPLMINPDLYAKMGSSDLRRAQFKVTGEEEHAGYNFNDLPTYSSLKFRPYQGECDDSNTGGMANYPIMRLEEMYFIQAEALIRSGHAEEGKQVLENFVKNYRDPGFSLTAGLSDEEYLDILFDQKRIELWGEGQIFFDYKRLNKSVDRFHITSGENIWPSDCQFITNGRPAWMNMVIPTSYHIFNYANYNTSFYNTSLDGYNNPDPSGCYTSGTPDLAEKKPMGQGYYSSVCLENLIEEDVPSVFRSASYSLSADESILYISTSNSSESLRIDIKEGQCSIPEQTVSFNGNSITIKAEGGILQDNIITFYSDGLWLKNGEKNMEATISRGEGIKFYLPDAKIGCSVKLNRSFYTNDYSKPMSVIQKDGKNYLRIFTQPYSIPDNFSAKVYVGAIAAGDIKDHEDDWNAQQSTYDTNYSNYLQHGCPYTLKRDGAEGSYTTWDITQETTNGQYIEVPLEGQLTGEQQKIFIFQTIELDGAVWNISEFFTCYPDYSNWDDGIYFLSNNEFYIDFYGKVQDLESETDAYVSVGQCFGEHVDAAYAFVVPADMTMEEALLAFKEKKYEMAEFELTHSTVASLALRIPVRERGLLKVACVAVSNGEAKNVAFSLQKFEYKSWKSLGMGKFADYGWMEGAPYEVEYQQNISDPTCFRIVKPYSGAYLAEGWYGETPSEYLNFRILQPGEVLKGVTITQQNLIVFDDCVTGYYQPDYDATLILCHPSDFSPTSTCEDDYIYNCVDSYQENGLPAVVYIAPWWYMNGVGGYNYSTAQYVELIFPGVEINATEVKAENRMKSVFQKVMQMDKDIQHVTKN